MEATSDFDTLKDILEVQFLLLSFFVTRIVSLKMALALLLRHLSCQFGVALAGNDIEKRLSALVLPDIQM